MEPPSPPPAVPDELLEAVPEELMDPGVVTPPVLPLWVAEEEPCPDEVELCPDEVELLLEEDAPEEWEPDEPVEEALELPTLKEVDVPTIEPPQAAKREVKTAQANRRMEVLQGAAAKVPLAAGDE